MKETTPRQVLTCNHVNGSLQPKVSRCNVHVNVHSFVLFPQYFFLFLLFCSTSFFSLYAQKNYATKPQKWTLGLHTGPTWNHFQTVYNEALNGPNYALTYTPKNTNHVGVEVAYFWSQSWGISVGAQYVNRGYYYKHTVLMPDSIDPFYGFVQGPLPPTQIRTTYNYQYVDFPISLQYVYGKKKWRFQTSAGLAMSYLFNATATVRYQNTSPVTRPYSAGGEPFHKFHIIPIVSVGAQYYLNKNWLVQLSPFGQHALTQISETPISERHWTLGLRAGMVYVF